MKKILWIVLLFETVLFAEDYGKLLDTSSTVKMQTLIGETAINNVLNAYFVGKHEIPVNGLGTVTVTVNNLGIDIQGKDDVVFGYDLTIASDFSSEISNVTGGLMKGSIPFKDAFSVQEVQNAYVTFMSLNKTIDAILVSYGIKNNSVSTAIKKVFETSDGMIELWRQEYSSLISASLKDAASSLDLSLVSRNLTYSVGGMADYIVIDLELNIKSNQQYFWIEGDFINSDKTFLASNKEFQALDISFSSMDEYLVGYRNSCPDYPKSDAKQIDLTEACSNDVEKIKGAVAFKSFHIYFLVKTKHGGILSFSRDIEPQGTH